MKKHTIPEDWPVQDKRPLFGDPKFKNPGSPDAADYIPSNKKLIKDKGIKIKKLPEDKIGLKIGLELNRDFFYNKITGLPDIGAVEIK